jgi:PAS domain S-box-containing protein
MSGVDREGVRVLHVDDEPEFTELTAAFLERDDDRFTVDTATGAGEALEMLNDRPPDCIVSDYNMPGMDGLELLEAVREEYADLPFVLFTGEGSEEVASDAISAGATDYLQKRSGTEQYQLLANRITNAVSQYRSEERLRETREEYTAVFENAQDGLLLVAVGGDGFRYRQCNPRAVELIGRDRSEIVGATPREALGPENAREVVGFYRACVERRESVEYTVTLDLPVGTVTRECKASPVTSDGGVDQLVVAFHDITDRKRRERELEEYETIIGALTDAVYVLDEEGRFTYVTDEFVELVGYDRETILGNTPSLIKDEDAIERAERQLGRLLSSDGPDTVRFEVTLHPRDGDPIVCQDHMGVLPYEGAEFEGSVGVLRDITARKAREREMEVVGRQYRTLVERFPDGAVFLFDGDLRFVRAGGEELTAVGLTPDEVEGATPQDLFPAEIADETVRYYRETLRGNAHTFEQEYGGERYQIQTVPVRTADGEIAHGMAVSRNVTEETERRRELERQNERLEEFAGIVSHDLRNPLNVAEGHLELARETCDSEHLDRTSDAIDRSLTLIEDLLTLAREDREVGDVEPVALGEVAERSWQTAETGAATLEAEVTRTIRADDSRLQQLLENLYRNAVEHGSTGSEPGADGTVERRSEDVTVVVGETEGGFYVADDGPGIAEADRGEVFEAGYSTTRGGTGLGLRIVEQVADAHGWEVTLTDGERGGARFEVTGVDVAD